MSGLGRWFGWAGIRTCNVLTAYAVGTNVSFVSNSIICQQCNPGEGECAAAACCGTCHFSPGSNFRSGPGLCCSAQSALQHNRNTHAQLGWTRPCEVPQHVCEKNHYRGRCRSGGTARAARASKTMREKEKETDGRTRTKRDTQHQNGKRTQSAK